MKLNNIRKMIASKFYVWVVIDYIAGTYAAIQYKTCTVKLRVYEIYYRTKQLSILSLQHIAHLNNYECHTCTYYI